MHKLFPFILLLLLSCQKNVQKNNFTTVNDTLPRILTSGLQDISQENAMNTVGKKYGFQFLHVGGCVIEKSLRDSMNFINRKIYKRIETKYGKYWRDKFYREVDLVRDLQYQVEVFLTNSKEISLLNSKYDIKDNISYNIEPEPENNIIIITAYEWQKINNTFQKIVLYTLAFDSKTKKITKLT